MQVISDAPPAMSTQELIDLAGKKILAVMDEEESAGANQDRIYLLRMARKSDLYFRALQNYAPEYYASVLEATNVVANVPDDSGVGYYDYNQNTYKGACLKLVAVLGNRMPNATAIPNNAGDPSAISAVESADNAALYIKENCELQTKSLYLVKSLFNNGTNFWYVRWTVDGEKNGYKQIQTVGSQPGTMGNASFVCPQCAQGHPAEGDDPTAPENCAGCGAPMDQNSYQPPTQVDLPSEPTIEQVPKGALEITLHNATEITVPLDATCIDDCPWLDYRRETHKSKVLAKWNMPDGSNPLREALKNTDGGGTDTSGEGGAGQYAENVRSAFASPIGLIRPQRQNYWTERDTWWTASMYEMIDDQDIRNALKQNLPTGVRIISVKGKIIDLQEEKLQDHWQEVKPLPSDRIMAEPLGNDWYETQDLINNMLNQRNEIVERCNDPGFADPRMIDFDAFQTRRDLPGELFPMLRPAGGTLADGMYRPPPVQFSEQIGPFCAEIVARTENNTGITPPIFGATDEDEPTARQAELKKNAALMQLQTIWRMMGKSLEKLLPKACLILADNEDGVLAFTQKDEFQEFQQMAVVIDDLRGDENGPKYHFEAAEAIPLSYSQQRDMLLWMMDKPPAILDLFGFNDPFNVFKINEIMGMPGQTIPLLQNLKKAMSVIKQLLAAKPVPGPVGPDGQPGPPQPSIQPDWEDDPKFSANTAKAFLQKNFKIKAANPDGYQNIILWGQACDAKANVPAPPPEPKTSIAVALKASDVGPALTDMVQKSGLVDKGTPITPVSPPPHYAPIPSSPEQSQNEAADVTLKLAKAAKESAIPPSIPVQ